MCLGEKLERGEKESAQKLPRILSLFFLFFFFLNVGSRSIYSENVPLRLSIHLKRPPATLTILAFS